MKGWERADAQWARTRSWASTRSAPVVATIAMFIPVLAYSVLGHRGHGGHPELVTPGDLWSLVASSLALSHANFAHVYVPHGALTSPPALEVVMAPFVLVAQGGGFVARYNNGHPMGMWLLFGPLVLLLASPLLFAVDGIARRWQLSNGRRTGLALVSALGVANVAGLWGHPEDCIAVAMVLWSALEIDRLGPSGGPRAAWLLGVGIAFQPLAVLGVAPILARVGWRAAAKVSWRLVLPSLLVLLAPLVAEPGRTWFVLVKQPFMPHFVSFTPLTHFAPVIAPHVDGGGSTRLLATLLSAGIAIVVCHRRHDLDTVLTMTAAAFFLRVLFETELNWYYVWPVAAVCLLLSARRGTVRLGVCSTVLMGTIIMGDRNAVHHIVPWWPVLMALLSFMVLCAVAGSPLSRAARLRLHAADGVSGGGPAAELFPLSTRP